jgi:hypothetical protein
MERSKVDFPDPEGPIRAIISPFRTSRETRSSAWRWPKVLEAFRIDRTAASVMWAVGAFPYAALASWHGPGSTV